MMASTGTWTTPRYVSVEMEKLKRDRAARATEERRAHRALDRRERLLRDLMVVDEKLKRLMKEHRLARRGMPHEGRMRTLLRRHNRLVDALNA